jgi:FkbM family methyltransferase
VNDLIYDVGAHIGDDTEFYLALGYRVVAVEANPVLADALRERFAGRPVTVVQGAVGDGESVRFFVNRARTVWGTTDPSWAARLARQGADSDEITVDGLRFADVITAHGCPHYLKIDIEGADMIAVDALRGLDCRPAYLSLECAHGAGVRWAAMRREIDTLAGLGYTRFRIVRQGWHKPGRFTRLGGERIPWTFSIDASGPFGEDLRGRWLTRRQALRRYALMYVLYRTTGEGTWVRRLLLRRLYRLHFWHDIHAATAPKPPTPRPDDIAYKPW